MGFKLTDYDANLAKDVEIKIDTTPIDDWNFMGGKIPLQFPPYISSDSKTTQWKYDNELPFAWEPLVIGFNASSRKISLKLQYIATGHTSNGVKWNTKNISSIVKDIRGYFYPSNVKAGAGLKLPIITIKMYDHIPESGGSATFRGISMSEKPGDSYITLEGSTYSFTTEVVLVLELTTNIKKKNDSLAYYPFTNLKNNPPAKWY